MMAKSSPRGPEISITDPLYKRPTSLFCSHLDSTLLNIYHNKSFRGNQGTFCTQSTFLLRVVVTERHNNQAMHCTHEVTLRRVRATIIVVKSNEHYILWVCVCSLKYPVCNAREPYCHLWPAPFYEISPHYLINGNIFEKKVVENKMCFDFLYNFVRNISHSRKNSVRYGQKSTKVFM